ncbi:hypothetical protein SAMN05216343_10493 [Oscillibacter sp. PC13]|nr:hypothetical protein SAMN05216343_10493 [Oscillibacter sp. PC13]
MTVTGKDKREKGLAGGIAILAAAACICIRGLKRVDAKLKEKAEKK